MLGNPQTCIPSNGPQAVCSERTGWTRGLLWLAVGRRLGEVHAAEEGFEAGVVAEGVEHKPLVECPAQSIPVIFGPDDPIDGLARVS